MNNDLERIKYYFPTLSKEQQAQFEQLKALYLFWNEQINLISRKDTDNFYTHHVLHSLAITKVLPFADGSKILDIGTGGGFPGIPLAIMFPKCDFVLVDSIGKKIKVVNEIATALGLTNVRAIHERAEKINEKFDFIVSRAVAAMPDFLRWTQNKFAKTQKNSFPNGILYLKGGDLTDEMATVKNHHEIYEIRDFFTEDFFATKKVVYVMG